MFPLAIGGCVTTERVCESCNSTLGSRVDSALVDNFLIRARRAQLGLAGNSGVAPALHEILLGEHTLASDPNRRIRVTFNDKTGKLDLRALYSASDITMPDGAKARRIIIDERDRNQIPIIIQRERRRHGVRPLTSQELAAEVQKAVENLTDVDKPSIHIQFSINLAFIRHAMFKIVYELAFLWLGEEYLDDPLAARLRAAICDSSPESTNHIAGYVGDSANCDAFKMWPTSESTHMAYAFTIDRGIAISVRIFDVFTAVVKIADDAGRYLHGVDGGWSKLRFLMVDPVAGRMHESGIMDEFKRMASVMTRQPA